MIGVAFVVGRAMAAGVGRKTIFLVAARHLAGAGARCFPSPPIRSAWLAIQLLDGIAAGIFGVVAVVIAADIIKGTGRFNLAQGLVALSVGVGAALRNLVSG